MIVIAIIGILAAIAVPSYQNYMVKSKVATGFTTLNFFSNKAAEYYMENGHFPQTVGDLGFSDGGVRNPDNGLGTADLNTNIVGEAGLWSGDCAVINGSTEGPCAWVMINSDIIPGATSPGILAMIFSETDGALVQTQCYTLSLGNNIPQEYLPAQCVTSD